MGGYAGKILKIDLTTREIEEIDTAPYEQWGGGHGMGSALFWDFCDDPNVLATDPGNVVTINTSPLTGTLAPSVAGRCEVTGIGMQTRDQHWYTRSNFGGRFSTHLKHAGWDAIVLLGKADQPTWINIVDGVVTFEDASELWSVDAWETQERIHESVRAGIDAGWWHSASTRDTGRTTQKPAVLTTGPNAEKYGPVASLIHGAGNAAGQGGFGGVFASKNLKAVSVVGTGGVEIADPAALMDARAWAEQYSHAGHWEEPFQGGVLHLTHSNPVGDGATLYAGDTPARPQGCVGCPRACRMRTASGKGNESLCMDFGWLGGLERGVLGHTTEATLNAGDLCNRYGVNAYVLEAAGMWLGYLLGEGLLGPGMAIDTSLPFHLYGTGAWAESLVLAIVRAEDIGAELSQGLEHAAEQWGRLETDLKSGKLPLMAWGYPHHYDGRTEVEWGYGSLLGSRDINEHDFNFPCYWQPTLNALYGAPDFYTAEQAAEIISEKLSPYNDPMMIDYSDEGIYSDAMVKTVAWHRHYTRFYKQSLGYCDWMWADFVNPYGPEMRGMTGEGEQKFFNAITGQSISFEDGMEIGRKIWYLDRAIWALQGRHRDQEVYADYMYEQPAMPGFSNYEAPYTMPVFEDGEWSFKSVAGRVLDRDKVEDWKTRYYEFEGFDPGTGRPTRASLADVNLDEIADALAAAGKLGGE